MNPRDSRVATAAARDRFPGDFARAEDVAGGIVIRDRVCGSVGSAVDGAEITKAKMGAMIGKTCLDPLRLSVRAELLSNKARARV